MTKLKVLKDGDRVSFHPFSEYGLAEFAFCLKYERGILKCVYISHEQQQDAQYHYRWDCRRRDGLTIHGPDPYHNPSTWLHYHCKYHRCNGFRLYVPRESNSFWVHLGSIYFER